MGRGLCFLYWFLLCVIKERGKTCGFISGFTIDKRGEIYSFISGFMID